MIPTPQPEPVRTAKDIASALGRSPTEKGVGKLAAALDQPTLQSQITDLLYNLESFTSGRSGELRVEVRNGKINWQVSVIVPGGCALVNADTLDDAVSGCIADAARVRRMARVQKIAEQLAEDEAKAEAALKATAPLEFVPDGSPADVLPIVSIGPFGIGGDGQREVKP